MKLQIGKTYQPGDKAASPVTITGRCACGIYSYIGKWGELPEEQDCYRENGMNLHVESEFDLIEEYRDSGTT
ncbi:hypothetical protein [Pedobacter sp.]|uniref:hypothetical protein n=1 Tax=Pedobacter sp. TaxID=1411316 RepID=UPI003C4BDC03